MHSYYAFLALDVARERAGEAERLYFVRHGTGGRRASERPVRRLADIVRGLRSLVAGRSATGAGTSPRLATSRER